jgi:anaerobic ribonucleoside-triphosphate reductase activating protein
LTVLGGEPFEPKNQPELTALLQRVKARYPHKTVWCFTGFRLDDELLRDGSYPRTEHTDEMLSYIDVLVDGRFVRELKDISLQFRGSRNQRVIDMNKTRATGGITIWEQLRR